MVEREGFEPPRQNRPRGYSPVPYLIGVRSESGSISMELVLLDRNRTVSLGVTGSALCHLSYSSGSCSHSAIVLQLLRDALSPFGVVDQGVSGVLPAHHLA